MEGRWKRKKRIGENERRNERVRGFERGWRSKGEEA